MATSSQPVAPARDGGAERSDAELRHELEEHRERLAESVAELRHELEEARPDRSLDGRLPLAVGVAGALGFLRAGGFDAAVQWLAARRRHERELRGLRRFRS